MYILFTKNPYFNHNILNFWCITCGLPFSITDGTIFYDNNPAFSAHTLTICSATRCKFTSRTSCNRWWPTMSDRIISNNLPRCTLYILTRNIEWIRYKLRAGVLKFSSYLCHKGKIHKCKNKNQFHYCDAAVWT